MNRATIVVALLLAFFSAIATSAQGPLDGKKNKKGNGGRQIAIPSDTKKSFIATPVEQGGSKRSRLMRDEDREDPPEDETPRKRPRGEPQPSASDPVEPDQDPLAITDKDIQQILAARSIKRIQEIFDRLIAEGKLTGSERGGFASTNVETTERVDFEDREFQIMRHITTQLLFTAAEINGKRPVEFQMMHMRDAEGNVKIFLSSNDRKSLKAIQQIMEDDPQAVSGYLLKDFSQPGATDPTNSLLARFAAKLSQVYNEERELKPEKLPARQLIRDLLGSIEDVGAGIIDLSYPKRSTENPLASDRQVFLVYGKNDVHAEMKFLDLIKRLETSFGKEELYDYTIKIAGTRRACSGCMGRLELAAHDHEISFTAEQGRIWKKSLLQLLTSEEDRKKLSPIIRKLLESTYKSERVGWDLGEESLSEAEYEDKGDDEDDG